MITPKPFSVKFPDELRAQIKERARQIGYSENQLIIESMTAMLELVDEREKPTVPQVVMLIRTAEDHRDKAPVLAAGEAPPIAVGGTWW